MFQDHYNRTERKDAEETLVPMPLGPLSAALVFLIAWLAYPVAAAADHRNKCQGGDAASCGIAAEELLHGEVADYEEVLALVRRGCNGDDGLSCLLLSYFQKPGPGNEDRLAYSKKSCTLGFGRGCEEHAKLLSATGRRDEGINFARKACATGHGEGCSAAAGMLLSDSRTNEAIPLAESGCARDDATSCALLGIMHRSEGRPDQALDAARKGVKLGSPLALAVVAEVLFSIGDDAEALRNATQGCDLDEPNACRIGAFWLSRHDRADEAIEWARKSCRLGQNEACGLATALAYDRGEQEAAFSEARERCDSGHAEGCTALALIHASEGRLEDAVAVARKSCFEFSGPCGFMSQSLKESGKVEEAIEFAREGCNRREVQACGWLSTILFDTGRYEEAIEPARNGCQHDDPAACGNLAAALSKFGRFTEALPHARKGCLLKNTDACGNLAGILARLGRMDEALVYGSLGCEGGSTGACGNLAIVLQSAGRSDLALGYMAKGCRHGVLQSCGNAAAWLVHDANRRPEAMEFAQLGCSGGNGESCGVLAVLLAEQRERDMMADIEPAMEAAQKGCDLGSGEACVVLAALVVDRSGSAPLSLFESACTLGNSEACVVVGRKRILAGDWAGANRAARSGCEGGQEEACVLLDETSFTDVARVDALMVKMFARFEAGELHGLLATLFVEKPVDLQGADLEWWIALQVATAYHTGNDSLALEMVDRHLSESLSDSAPSGVWSKALARFYRGMLNARQDVRSPEVLEDLAAAERLFRAEGFDSQADSVLLHLGRLQWKAGLYEQALGAFTTGTRPNKGPLSIRPGEPVAESPDRTTVRKRLDLLVPVGPWSAQLGKGLALGKLQREPIAALDACSSEGDVWSSYCRALNLTRLGEVAAAAGMYRKALEAINRHLDMTAVFQDTFGQASTADDFVVVIDDALRFLLGPGHDQTDSGRDALFAIEILKARGMVSSSVLRHVALSAGAEKEYHDYLQALQRAASYRQAARPTFGPVGDAPGALPFQAEIDDARSRLTRRVGSQLDFSVPADFDKRVCSRLPVGSVVLDFAAIGIPVQEQMVIAGIRKSAAGCEIRMFRAGSVENVRREGQGLLAGTVLGGPHELVSIAEFHAQRSRPTTEAEWAEIREALFGEALSWVREATSHVLIAPWGPVEAIAVEYTPGDWNGALSPSSFLADAKTVVRVPSLALLLRQGKREKERKGYRRALAYSGIDYDAPINPAIAARQPPACRSEMVALSENLLAGIGEGCNASFRPLPRWALKEAFSRARLPMTERADAAATETQFRRDVASSAFDIVYLLTHGMWWRPECIGTRGRDAGLFRAGLMFAGVNRLGRKGGHDPSDDGELTAAEALGMTWSNVRIVVLGACMSGVGESQGFEGRLGFPNVLLQAGVEHVLVALRSVPYQETAEIIEGFFKHLVAGSPPQQALALARRAYMLAHPAEPYAGTDLVLISRLVE